ncbi:hypothetical protein [Desulfovibrio legallii]|uniref:hypothetical protein n=1 Tax=Desulfovibrio legallii TaxID=571438 RepID=UPI001178C013|nr:hypothetical protein [Desulfovibrio legallii]
MAGQIICISCMQRMDRFRYTAIHLLLFTSILFYGCASQDYHLTKFRPTTQDEQYQYYLYESFADAAYPVDSDDAEKIRLQWLKKWISENNITNKFDITSRRTVKKSSGLFGDIYDIYYEVRVHNDIN